MTISNHLLNCHCKHPLQALICQSQALHKASLRARRCLTRHGRQRLASRDFATPARPPVSHVCRRGTSNAPCHVRMVPRGF